MQLSEALAQAETALQALTSALTGPDANALETRSTQLRDAFMSLAVQRQQHARSGQPLEAALQQRIDAIGHQLGPLRDQLARINAMAGHQVAALLPAQAGAPTYDALSGRSARSLPRIYRDAG